MIEVRSNLTKSIAVTVFLLACSVYVYCLLYILKDKNSARVLLARFHYFKIIHQPYTSRY